MTFEKTPAIPILRCTACGGTGFVKMHRCRSCRGMIRGRLLNDVFFFFGEPLTRYHIRLKRARRTYDYVHCIGALIFAIGFLGFFFFLLFTQDRLDDVVRISFWKEIGGDEQLLFWLSLLFWCYVIYRFTALGHPARSIPYGADELFGHRGEGESRALSSWQEAFRIFRKKRVDISHFFSEDAMIVLEEAYRIADRAGGSQVLPEDIFLALLRNSGIKSIFLRLGIPADRFVKLLMRKIPREQTRDAPTVGDDIDQLLFVAYDTAREAKQDHVFVTELLSASVATSSLLQEVLYDLNVDTQKLNNVIEWLRIREELRRGYLRSRRAAAHRSKYGLDRAMTAVATPYLNNFSQDLTMAAMYGYLSPCIAREKEMEEIFRVIEGGRQSVLLVGPQSVGKMSVIEGVALRMIEDDVPKRLNDKRLVQLSSSSLLAGTTIAGAQERLIRMMQEIRKAKNIILFINNVHDLMSGGGEKQVLDVSETLAEYLGKGNFLCFATTTVEGYNKYILNSEVGSVFSRIDIHAMDENQAIQVLESKVGQLEYKHHVFFSYEALDHAVTLAGRFLHDVPLPESAIGLMSEAASFVRRSRGERQLVRGEDVAVVVSEKTGIPSTAISEDESAKLLRLEEAMHARVIGQHEAVVLVANALRRARADIRSRARPIATFLFLGPTGVGKTELAKTIAEVYFGAEKCMIRIDMSEYQDKASIYRLIGEPGAQGTGLLTEAVRQHPFSLVLLDELEKADPDVLNLFLQVFDDGRLTDSVGRVIDFTNTIIIATSNAGTAFVQEKIQEKMPVEDIRQLLIRGELKQYYRPEFLNRFDGIVLFRSLTKKEIKQVASLMLARVAKDLEQKGVFLRVEDAALDALAEAGFDPEFGARPMRRAIQDRIENTLAELVLGNKLRRRDTVVIGEKAEIRVEKAGD